MQPATESFGYSSSCYLQRQRHSRGYHVILGLAHLVMESDGWQHVFAGMGALIIGLTAAVRLSDFDRAILAAERSRSHPRPRCQALGKTG